MKPPVIVECLKERGSSCVDFKDPSNQVEDNKLLDGFTTQQNQPSGSFIRIETSLNNTPSRSSWNQGRTPSSLIAVKTHVGNPLQWRPSKDLVEKAKKSLKHSTPEPLIDTSKMLCVFQYKDNFNSEMGILKTYSVPVSSFHMLQFEDVCRR